MQSNPVPTMWTTEAPPLPTTMKKPRRKAREVSSRYMATPTPMPTPSSSPIHYSSFTKHCSIIPSVPSSPDATDSESESSARFPDENQLNRTSLETPIPQFVGGSQNNPFGTQRRRAVRLFGDNGGNQEPPRTISRKPRPGTPFNSTIPKAAVLGHTTTQLRVGRNNSVSVVKGGKGKASSFRRDDACSESCSTMGDSEVEIGSGNSHGGFCDSPPIMGSKVGRQVSEFRSSMPEGAHLLPGMSSRRNLDGNEDSSSASLICSRSLNMALSSCQPSKPNGRFVPSRICLPPQPPSSRLEVELKKGKKGASNKQEDIHMLRLLYNKYLQWRFVNVKAKEAVENRTNAAEKSLYGLSAKISEMQNSVLEKRMELERLRRIRSLTDILEPQMPYLDEWTTVQEEYSSSLSGVTEALQDASLRLPIAGNVKADIRDLKEAFNSATNICSSLSTNIERFLPKAEGIEDIISDLAKLSSTERSLIEECGNLLSEAHNLQVTECSLRGQLIQAKMRSGNTIDAI